MNLHRTELSLIIAIVVVAAFTFLPMGAFVMHLLGDLTRAVGGAP